MNYGRSLILILFLAGISLSVSTVIGQVKNGKIEGRVADSSGSALQGAQVTVQPGGYSCTCDQQGGFSIPDVAAGDYTIAISYIGFALFSSKVRVTAGQAAKVDAALQVASAPEYPAYTHPNGTLLEEPTSPLTAATFVGSQTSLLWPYITNLNGGTAAGPLGNWDTAIEVANTTSDPFGRQDYGGAIPQDGSCTFYVYAAGTAPAGVSATSVATVTATPIAFTRNVILSGGVDFFFLSQTNAAGVGNGYMIATCNFLDGVGFAAVIDNANGLPGNWGIYASYLAYVIPNPNLVGRSFNAVTGEFAIAPWSFQRFDGAGANSSSSNPAWQLRRLLK